MTIATDTPERLATALTPEQRRIVEWDEGPVVVIAGAGTGKTRVIVERVRHLLAAPREPGDEVLPEQILVLTYNVKAARELQQRLDATIGVTARARMTVSNFHSFCQRVLTESAADASLPPQPDVLDGIGHVLPLRDIRPHLELVYHSEWSFSDFAKFISRAKDELVSPADFDAFVERERRTLRRPVWELRSRRRPDRAAGQPRAASSGALRLRKLRANQRAEGRGVRTNILRRWQRQYRYLLIDEFQDANVAQIELIELLGRAS